MSKVLLMLSMVIGTVTCWAEITRINDMQEVVEACHDADEHTWVVFDVDMVLIQPSDPAFQMANIKRFKDSCQRMINQVSLEKQMILFSLMSISAEPVLVDERTPQFIDQMIRRGVPTMALTANLTGSLANIPNMEQWRVAGLRRLGIDFSRGAPCSTQLVFDELASYRHRYPTYFQGILFVNGKAVSKGEAFLAFLDKIGVVPNKVIFVDDQEHNLKSLEAALHKLDSSIEYRGLHYLGAQTYPSKMISEAEFQSRWQNIVSEVEALD